ncbi:ABC transporter permease [soil metagenome]
MNLAEYAAENHLHRVGARPPLHAYLNEVWRRRLFIYSLSKFRIQAQHQRSRLGMAWIVINPLLETVIYGTIFGIILGSTRPPNFIEFLIVGLFIYDVISSSLTAGAKSITGNGALVQSLSFPRMVLPLASTVQEFLNFVPKLIVMVTIVAIFGSPPNVRWLLMLPLIAMMVLFSTGLALIMARLTVHFTDLNKLLPFITRILFYTSGVFFAIETVFAGHPTIARLYEFQPFHEFLSLARNILIENTPVDNMFWLYASIWAVVTFAIGVWFFWSAEESYGRND